MIDTVVAVEGVATEGRMMLLKVNVVVLPDAMLAPSAEMTL